MSNDANTPWWEMPGAPGENRTKEQYDAMIAATKEPNPNRKPPILTGAAKLSYELWQSSERELVASHRERFEDIIRSLNYDGANTDSLTVGEIRRALPVSNGERQ